MNTIYVCDSCGEQHYFEKTWNIDATCPTCGDNLGGYIPEDIVDDLIAACRLVLEFYYVGSDQISPPVRDAIEAALAKAEPKERGE